MPPPKLTLATEHALDFSLAIRRLRNGRLDAQTLRQSIESERITVLGDTLVNDVPRIIEHAALAGRLSPTAISSKQSDVIEVATRRW